MESEINTFAVYEDGNIADGQHRLMAIWLGGITLDNCMIINGVQRDSLFDVGQARTTAQNLNIRQSLKDSRHIPAKVSLAKFLLTYSDNGKKSDYIVERFIQKYENAINIAVNALYKKAVPRVSTAPIAAAVAVALINGVTADVAEDFCESMLSGIVMEPEKLGIVAFRNKLLQVHTRDENKQTSIDKFLQAQRVLKSVVDGVRIKNVTTPDAPIWEIEEMRKGGKA